MMLTRIGKIGTLGGAVEVLLEDINSYDIAHENGEVGVAADQLEEALEEFREHEGVLSVLLAALREEVKKHGLEEAQKLVDDLVTVLDEMVELPLQQILATEKLIRNGDIMELVPNAPPGASA